MRCRPCGANRKVIARDLNRGSVHLLHRSAPRQCFHQCNWKPDRQQRYAEFRLCFGVSTASLFTIQNRRSNSSTSSLRRNSEHPFPIRKPCSGRVMPPRLDGLNAKPRDGRQAAKIDDAILDSQILLRAAGRLSRDTRMPALGPWSLRLRELSDAIRAKLESRDSVSCKTLRYDSDSLPALA
jgi:hypothetical protein